MNDFPKVLVVDDGERTPDGALSADLASMGYASVTTSLEATEDVLSLIPAPAAILLQLPKERHGARHWAFLNLAERLKTKLAASAIPVIVVEPNVRSRAGATAALLRGEFVAQPLAKPER